MAGNGSLASKQSHWTKILCWRAWKAVGKEQYIIYYEGRVIFSWKKFHSFFQVTGFTSSFFFQQIAIVITDGEQTTNKGPYTPLSIASRGLKDKNVRVYALGIGKRINRDQLNEIASSNVNIFTATSFSELAPLAQIIVQYSSNPGRPWQMHTIHPPKWQSTSTSTCPVNSPRRESRKYTLFFVFRRLGNITYTECSRQILRSGRWAGGVIIDTAHLGPAPQDSKRTPRVDRMPISFWVKEKRVCRLFYKKYIGIIDQKIQNTT